MTTNSIFVCSKELVGQVAHWAVRQSPYAVPVGLEAALAAFSKAIDPEFIICRSSDNTGWRYFSGQREIEEFLRRTLFPIPEVAAWNERRNGRQGMGFSSRYGQPEPDDDFVDLDALAMNVGRCIEQEAVRDTVIDQQLVGRVSPGAKSMAFAVPPDPEEQTPSELFGFPVVVRPEMEPGTIAMIDGGTGDVIGSIYNLGTFDPNGPPSAPEEPIPGFLRTKDDQ